MATYYCMFEDGPAKGVPMMMLQRCPQYLRVVRSMDGRTWDEFPKAVQR